MIDSQGWFDWAERVSGHPDKLNKNSSGVPLNNPVQGIFLHSAEGYETYLRTNPPQPPAVGGQKSWHLTNLFSGRLLQHYPLNRQCWHATAGNSKYVGMEHEGRVPVEPTLTDAQIATSRRVIAEISQEYGWIPSRPSSISDTSHTLWEHKEVVRLGGTSSSCPSGRIPWDKILVTEPPVVDEDEMIRHNAIHKDNGFRDREIDANGIHLWDVRGDFGLPDEARLLRIEIYLNSGEARVHDGDAGSYAGRVGWGSVNYGIVDVDISDNSMTFYGPCKFAILGCVGYWR